MTSRLRHPDILDAESGLFCSTFQVLVSTCNTMGVIGEICLFGQKVIFLISSVLTIFSDSQDLKPYVIKEIHTFSSL